MDRILIVEDDEHIAMAMKVRLEANDFEVLTAIDAIVGLDKAVKLKPDLVLLDISMPGGNGLKLAERMKAVVENPPPFIVITASNLPDLREKATALGASGFYEKPFNVDDVVPVIRDAIRLSRQSEGGSVG
jgi:two-component system response regulator AdeR